MAFQATETHANTDIKPFKKQYRLFHAAFAQFCYTGAQVGIAGFVSPSQFSSQQSERSQSSSLVDPV
jgi:fucose permease